MYKEIDKLGGAFTLLADDDTSDRLGEAYSELAKILNVQQFTIITEGLKGTHDFSKYRFDVQFQGTTEFELLFHDYRGGAMMSKGDDLDRLRTIIRQSHVIFNILDATALMEATEPESDQLNGHSKVAEILKHCLDDDGEYLVLFVLVKAETYVKNRRKRQELESRFERWHKQALNVVNKSHRGNVAGVLIPVCTLNCVEFKELDEQGSFVFVRNRGELRPKDVDQPLRYALAFAIKHVEANKWFLEKFWDWLTGKQSQSASALKKFYETQKLGYRKYGNVGLLNGD